MTVVVLIIIGIFVFVMCFGFWAGWYVRGAYPSKRMYDALITALEHSSLTLDNALMVAILGRELSDQLNRRRLKEQRCQRK